MKSGDECGVCVCVHCGVWQCACTVCTVGGRQVSSVPPPPTRVPFNIPQVLKELFRHNGVKKKKKELYDVNTVFVLSFGVLCENI